MDRFDAELRRELGRFGPATGMAEVSAAWPDAVGEAVARNAWPARVGRDGTLHVAVSSATWAFELGGHAETILGRLREALGDDAPPALRFAPGKLPAPAADDLPPPPPPTPKPTADEAAIAREVAAPIDDPELRELVARAVAASLARGSSDRGV